MARVPEVLSNTFNRFFSSEKSAGNLLIACTLVSVAIANSPVGPSYVGFWQQKALGLSVEHWVNDALMAIFFLLIGLELERELYVGELSDPKKALLPLAGALGGMIAPALIHFAFNGGAPTQAGFGIPMATDIAFALGVLALLGERIPTALKVFVVAFAVIDDLGAIIVIALFYTADLHVGYLAGSLGVWAALVALNRLRVMAMLPYLIGGALMWFLMLRSGVHATLAGVLLAFAIPFTARDDDEHSPSHRLEHLLHKPVAFGILPVFALANTGVIVGAGWMDGLLGNNSIGIIAGLVVGKPLGVVLVCLLAVAIGLCRLPEGVNWRHMAGAGALGGIGFTMSIFITNLAFPASLEIINAAKMAILCGSLLSGVLGFFVLSRK